MTLKPNTIKKTGIIELFEHHELVRPLLEQHGLASLKLWVSETVNEQLFPRQSPPNVFVRADHQPVEQFLDRHREHMKACDQLIITTLADHFKAFSAFDWPAPTLLIIHNAHAFFNPKALYLGGNAKDKLIQLGRIIYRLGWKRDNYYRKKVLNSIDQFAFVDPLMADHVVIPDRWAEKYVKGPRFYQTIPKKSDTSSADAMTITFPGRVDLSRKDYTPYLQNILQHISNSPTKITLIFLGPIKGKKETAFLTHWKKRFPPDTNWISFTMPLPHALYNHYLQQTDLLILPLKPTVRFSVYKEFVGKTKISGGVHDGLRYGIPTIVPDFYPIQKELESILKRWDDFHLYKQHSEKDV